ncbi:hypothetical protein RFI_21508, partial [Reticulomyxa filosa]
IHGTINGKDVWLSDLKNCKIRICDHIGALRMNNIHSCTIITGPITTSLHRSFFFFFFFCFVFIWPSLNNYMFQKKKKKKVHSMMRQCRIHDAKDTKFYIHVNSEPVIENSKGILFGVYGVQYKSLNDQISTSGIDKDVNVWDKVKDFNWFRQQQSPNWSLLPLHERSSNIHI